jgi:signal transduction histidine kinase
VELAELMRGSERTEHVPIVLITAGTHERSRLFSGYEAGAVDFLYKPIEPVVLRNKAETFFQLYRQKQLLARQVQLLRETASEREELTGRLQETLRLNEMFMAAVGHDLRNPLAAVISGAKLVARRTEDAEVRRLADAIRNSGARMQRMTSALFDLTRARLDGGIPIERTRLDLRPLAERVFDEQRLASPNREMSMHIEGTVDGDWDGTRLEQLLSNLLGNAIQHGAASAPVEVDLIGTAAEEVWVSVRSGGAIPNEIVSGLFDPFRKRAKSRSDGLGLGLFIVQQIAHAHGGSVLVAAEDASATTTFRVQLPRHRGDA